MRALSPNPLNRFQWRETAASQLAPPRVDESLAVGFESAAGSPTCGSSALRARSAWVCARSVARCDLARLGTVRRKRCVSSLVQCQLGQVERGVSGVVSVCGVSSGSPSASLSAALRHVQVRRALDALLVHGGQVDPDGEHIDIGGHAGGAHRFGARQVGFGGAHGLLGGLQAFRRQDRAVIGARRPADHVPSGRGAALRRSSSAPVRPTSPRCGSGRHHISAGSTVTSDWKLLRKSGRFKGPMAKFSGPNWCWVSSELKTKTGLSLRAKDSV